jgi:hypothetical protein
MTITATESPRSAPRASRLEHAADLGHEQQLQLVRVRLLRDPVAPSREVRRVDDAPRYRTRSPPSSRASSTVAPMNKLFSTNVTAVACKAPA